MSRQPDPDFFAQTEYNHYRIYDALAKRERDPEFKEILAELALQEKKDFEFWRELSKQRTFSVRPRQLFFSRLIRLFFGVTFTVKVLERGERSFRGECAECLTAAADEETKRHVEQMLSGEQHREEKLLSYIQEGKVKFLSSIVLGINDGLIELTGALVGFSFALGRPPLVALTGAITGIAASLSMAASAYLQARHEEGKDSLRAGLYTGVSYLIVVTLLVGPFLIFPTIRAALILMFLIVFSIITLLSFYTAVLFERSFRKQFTEIAVLSLGVAAIAFVIGTLFRDLSGISV